MEKCTFKINGDTVSLKYEPGVGVELIIVSGKKPELNLHEAQPDESGIVVRDPLEELKERANELELVKRLEESKNTKERNNYYNPKKTTQKYPKKAVKNYDKNIKRTIVRRTN